MISNYFKLALKVLARRKFFTFISLFGISLTLVVLMVGTAVLDNVFAPLEPETRLDRTLGIFRMALHGKNFTRKSGPGYRFLDQWVRTMPGVERVSVFSQVSPTAIYAGSRKIDAYLKRTDGEYWQILDFRFLEGGPFSSVDEKNRNFVAVIDEETRTKVFGLGPAVGRSINLGGQRFRVVGVVPNVPITRMSGFADVWVPISTAPSDTYRHQFMGDFSAIVLARSRADFPRLKREFATRMKTVPLDDPKDFDRLEAGLDTFFEAVARMLVGDTPRRALTLRLVLIAAAVVFITLPTLNLVSINLSRIMERASEIGVRKSFGASGGTLIGQFVVENIVLTVLGGLIGFVLSAFALALLNWSEVLPDVHFALNLRVFGWGMLIAVLFGTISGLWPAWRMSRLHPVEALRGGAM